MNAFNEEFTLRAAARARAGQKTWLCEFRKKTIEYVISRVTRSKKGKIKMIKSLLQNEHPCEYAVFLKGFLEKDDYSKLSESAN